MNLRPPPTTNNIAELRSWCAELYRFLEYPIFPGGAGFGGTSNNVYISNTGDITFAGTSGIIFGGCYGNEIGWSQAAVQNTWYNIIDSDIGDGQLNGVAHDGNGKLTVTAAGVYQLAYSLVLEISAANNHVEMGIEISDSGSAEGGGQAHIEAASANKEYTVAAVCNFALSASDTVEVAVRTTDSGTPTITVKCLNLILMMVGGA